MTLDEFSRILNIDTTAMEIETGCFNGISDVTIPYTDVDFFVKTSTGICIFIYGCAPIEPLKNLADNEYAIFMLSSDLNGTIERNHDNHIYIC